MPVASSGLYETITLAAAADLSGKQFHAVRLSAADTCNLASQAADQNVVGILLNKPAAVGRAATVVTRGEIKACAGAAITAGDFVTTNGSGRLTAARSGDMVLGRAITAGPADGQYFRLNVDPFFNGIVTSG